MSKEFLLNSIIGLGLSKEQAKDALIVVSEYAKEKLPVLRGSISIFLNHELEEASEEGSCLVSHHN